MKKIDIISYITILVLGSEFSFYDSANYKEGLHSALIFCGSFIGLLLLKEVVWNVLFKNQKKKSEQYRLQKMDERLEKKSLKFMAQVFGLSHLIGSAILFVLYIINQNMMIPVSYVLYYVFGVLFFTMMFGLKIVKTLDK